MQCLGHRDRQPLGLEFRHRRIENRLRTSQVAEKFPGHARAEARRQRKRQPSQVLVGVHRGLREAYADSADSVKLSTGHRHWQRANQFR